jgi:hypothetical protein
MADIAATTPGNCAKNLAPGGAAFQKYPGAALTLAGAGEQTLAK